MIIPVDMDNVPTSQSPLDESLVYAVSLKKLELSTKRDKNGDQYFKITTEVIDGDYKGRTLSDNYVRLPVSAVSVEKALGRTLTENERREANEKGVRFAQMVKCFSIPYTSSGIDVERGIGRAGKVTIKNEEYPQGSGELRSKIQNYIPA